MFVDRCAVISRCCTFLAQALQRSTGNCFLLATNLNNVGTRELSIAEPASCGVEPASSDLLQTRLCCRLIYFPTQIQMKSTSEYDWSKLIELLKKLLATPMVERSPTFTNCVWRVLQVVGVR